MKEKYLEEYLKVTNDKIPKLIDILHPINKLSNNYIFEFGDLRGRISELKDLELKGEIVLIVEGNKQEAEVIAEEDLLKEVEKLIASGLKTKQAVKEIADKYKVSKNDLYNKYLKNK